MRLLVVAILLVITIILWQWINNCGYPLSLADLVPFSSSHAHDFDYNYASIVLLVLTALGVRRIINGNRRI